jgi:hypothetical protein
MIDIAKYKTVSHYRVTRHFGGHEEGGWWYDRYRHVETLVTSPTHAEAKRVAAELNEQAKNDKRQPSGTYQGRYSVANNTDDHYLVEETPGQHDNTDEPRPHYE